MQDAARSWEFRELPGLWWSTPSAHSTKGSWDARAYGRNAAPAEHSSPGWFARHGNAKTYGATRC